MTLSAEKCYLCGHSKSEVIHPRVRDREDICVRECLNCGLVFLDSVDHATPAFYDRSGMYGGAPPDMGHLISSEAADTERRVKLLQNEVRGKNYLDFGCGTGSVLAGLAKFAAKASGVEINSKMRAFINEKYRLQVFASIAEANETFDVISAFHVVEHLPDPRQILHQLATLLKPGGFLEIEVPSADDALIKLYQCTAFKNFTYWSCHLFLFTPTTLKTLVEQANLRVESLTQVQRYPLANHLYWLSHGKPGGHQHWPDLSTPTLEKEYQNLLAKKGLCDTLICRIKSH